MIITGTLIDEEIRPKGEEGRHFNRLTRKIKVDEKVVFHVKYYNETYAEEYLNDADGNNIFRQIYLPHKESSKLTINII